MDVDAKGTAVLTATEGDDVAGLTDGFAVPYSLFKQIAIFTLFKARYLLGQTTLAKCL